MTTERKRVVYPGVSLAAAAVVEDFYSQNEHKDGMANAVLYTTISGEYVVYQTKTQIVFRTNGRIDDDDN